MPGKYPKEAISLNAAENAEAEKQEKIDVKMPVQERP